MFLRPIRRHILLSDPACGPLEPELHLDFHVVAIGFLEPNPGFGVGDRILLGDPNAGRKVKLDGCVYRVVRVTDILAVIE